MNRRSFLKALAGAGLVVASPELILPERRVFALDQTMVPGLEIPKFKPGFQMVVGRLDPGPDGRYSTIKYWASDSQRGIFVPGEVETTNPDARVVFLESGGFIQAHFSSHFPKGMGVPAWDKHAIFQEWERLRHGI